MSLRKESDKHLRMDKKESSFRKEERKNFKSNNEESIQINKQVRPSNSNTENSNDKKTSNGTSFKEKTQDSLTKGFQTYKNELESDDYGVESSGKMSEHTFKATKKTINNVQSFKKSKLTKEKDLDNDGVPDRIDIDDTRNSVQTVKDLDAFKNSPKNIKNSKTNVLKKADEEHLNSVKGKLRSENKNKQEKPSTKITKGNKHNEKSFIKKVINQPKKTAVSVKNKGIDSYKETLESDDDGVKIGSKGSKLVKDGVRSINQVKRVQGKTSSSKKLRGFNTKLKSDSTMRRIGNTDLSTKFNQSAKSQFKKRTMRKNIYKNKPKAPATLAKMSKKTGLLARNGINAVRKLAGLLFKKIMTAKMFAWVGAISLKLLPVFAVLGVVITVIIIAMAMGGGNEKMNQTGIAQGLDPEVEQWRDLVTEIAENKNMSDYIDLVLAIIQVETGGTGTPDIMQSSESAGHPRNYFQDERQSVEQGISHLKNVVDVLKNYNNDFITDTKLIAQTYNFGLGFARHVGNNNYDGYSIDVSEKYSKDVVAVSLGNLNGSTYPYVNAISQSLGKTYLYSNGGNFLYGELIGQYIVDYGDGEIAAPVTPLIVTSHFGHRDSPGGIGSTNHKGIDFDCTGGVTPINSILSGIIVKSKYMNGLGNTVIVQHENNLYSTYGHMNSLSVQKGQKVSAGQILGVCGTTGNSTGAHLHLEISPTPHQNQVNPFPYFQHLIGG